MLNFFKSAPKKKAIVAISRVKLWGLDNADEYGYEGVVYFLDKNNICSIIVGFDKRALTEAELVEQYGEDHPEPGTVTEGDITSVFSPLAPLKTIAEAERVSFEILRRYRPTISADEVEVKHFATLKERIRYSNDLRREEATKLYILNMFRKNK